MTDARRSLALAALAAVVLTTSIAVTPATARTVDGPGDAALTPAVSGLVSGRLLIVPAGGGSPVVANAGTVSVYPVDGWPGAAASTAVVGPDGTFSFAGLPAGDYEVEFISTDTRALPVREWFDDFRFVFDADTVTLTDGVPYPFGDVVLGQRQFNQYRVAGDNRFATAVAIGQPLSPDGADRHVIIVNGLTFPDALSAGPYAGRDASPVLMVTATSIPPETLAELTRIDPYLITIVGGTGVVSAAVETQLRTFVPNPTDVVRVSGADRYATSRALVTLMQSQVPLNSLFIATGRDFPDALAAVPAAGAFGGAVLLVDGSRSTLDTASRDLIDSLNRPVTLIGGTGSISAGIATQIAGLGVSVDRVQGASRYETAIAIADAFFPQRELTYIATGTGFADALAIGWWASVQRTPLTLTQSTCVPPVVLDNIHDSLVGEFFLVGGTGSLSTAIETLTPCAP